MLLAAGLIWHNGSSAFGQDETKLLDTDNNNGKIVIFHGPDDLHLDPATAVIAVDCYGDDDVVVNGVTFIADKSDDLTTGEAEANGVKVTTTAANQIDAWSATTTFEGADQDSADNLATVMESIRWEGAPNPITIEIEGLTPGTLYELQLLTNEGRGPTRYRVWDVTVEDELVADNITSIGRLNEDEWDETNSAAYVAEFKAPDDGILNVEMAQDLGGDPSGGVDNNPILNAIVIHKVSAGVPALIIEDGIVGNQAFGGAMGMDFVVNSPIQVEQLGAFDSESDELGLPITVELWSRDDGGTPDDFTDDSGGEILTSLTLEEEEGTLDGGTRFSPLDPPVVLQPGAYTIVGWGYGEFERNYNVGDDDPEGQGLTITDSTFISFVGSSRFGDAEVNGQWPATLDVGPVNRYGAGNFTFSTTGDSDGDGMPDSYEEANGLNPSDSADAALDADGDGLTNKQEYDRRTNPNKTDSDDDGLSDKVETGTMVWVSAEDTGTDPTKPDTDRDGLSDGIETNSGIFAGAENPGTHPLKDDTDGDGARDGSEVSLGSNPLDPNSLPPSDTVVFTGFVSEIFGPDDLHLDPATAVIAVDVFGDEDREVNGVLFQTDKDDEGVAERDGVTVTTTATNSIDGWAAAPAFVGGQGDSATNLGEIMADIRWEAAPNPVTIDIEGLTPGALYEIQLLVNEGADRERHWDIGVEDELVVDDFGSEGLTGEAGGVWSPENSFTYTGEFAPSADGVLNIVMQQHIGGQDQMGLDNNPILQAIIVHSTGPGQIFQITNLVQVENEVSLTWASSPSGVYSVDYKRTLTQQFWIELDDSVTSEGETTSFTDDDPARTSESEGYYRVRSID
ncbi:MAG: hypothetical protein ACI9R3_001884 [Verrucomicrobiales bacterium]